MPEHRLRQSMPLGSHEPVSCSIGRVTIAETRLGSIAWLSPRRGCRPEFDDASRRIGLPLAGPGRLVRGMPWTTVWLAPDQWLVFAPVETHGDIATLLATTFSTCASIAELTDAFAAFDLTGSRLPDLLERLVMTDIRSMRESDAVRSMIEHIDCHVLHNGAEHVTLLAPRSFAASLHHALVAAATSVFGS